MKDFPQQNQSLANWLGSSYWTGAAASMLDITKEIFPDFIVRCLISVCRSLPLSFHFVVATRTTDTNLYDRSGHKWKNVIECWRFFCTCYSPSLFLHYIRDGVARTARGSTRNSSRAPVVRYRYSAHSIRGAILSSNRISPIGSGSLMCFTHTVRSLSSSSWGGGGGR